MNCIKALLYLVYSVGWKKPLVIAIKVALLYPAHRIWLGEHAACSIVHRYILYVHTLATSQGPLKKWTEPSELSISI